MKTFNAVFAAFFLIVVSFGFDLGYTLTSISEIKKFYNIKLHDIQWIVNIYVLFFATLLLPFSVIAAKAEKKLLCTLGVLLFAISAVIAFATKELRFLLVARALSGVSMALLIPASFGLVEKKMTFPFGLWTLALGIGLAIGPLASALFVDNKWAINAGYLVGLVFALVAGALLILKAKKTNYSTHNYPDPFGLVVLAASTALFVWGLIELPIRGTLSVRTLGPLVVGLIGFILFCFWEKRSREETVLHKKSFFTREFLLSALGSFILFFAIFIAYFLVPLYAKHIMHLSKAELAFCLLFLSLPLAILGFFLLKEPKATFKLSLILACVLLVIGCYIQSVFQGKQMVLLIAALLTIGLAAGILLPAIDEESTYFVAKKDQPKSFGQLVYFQALGLSFATAIGSAFYRYEDILLKTKRFQSGPGSWINQILQNIFHTESKHKDYIGETINRFLVPFINKSFLEAYDHIMWVIIGFSIILLVLTFVLLRREKLQF